MEYYSAIERNKIELFVMRWMDRESVIQSEVSQKEKNKYCISLKLFLISKPYHSLVTQEHGSLSKGIKY